MKKTVRQIAFLTAGLLLFCVLHRIATGNQFTVLMPLQEVFAEGESVKVTAETPEQIQIEESMTQGRYARIRVQPRHQGEATIHLMNNHGMRIADRNLQIGPLMTVYDQETGDFTGDREILVAFTLFCFAVAFIMMRYYRKLTWPDFYSYNTIFSVGLSLFSGLIGLLMAYVSIHHILYPVEYPMLNAYRELSMASYYFILATAPLIICFSAALIISNAELLRHEKPSIKNALGILAGIALLGGAFIAWLMYRDGIRPASRFLDSLRGIYTTVYVYLECMLASAVICGLKAGSHQPPYDRDFILILGCGFRKNGTLTPLLRGRVDQAIDFWRKQRVITGKEAFLIPSGGQGPDESMPEAEAIKDYILSRHVPPEYILTENRSCNTFQNMQFSKQIIERQEPNAKIAYATTNYHVFRSGVWASLAGLPAEGIGSKTKWWFWPNAFMRECVGLIRNHWKQETGLLLLIIGFFTALSMTL